MKCCYGCVAPKRHLACHGTCEEYKKEKEEHVAKKKKIREIKDKEARIGRVLGRKYQD